MRVPVHPALVPELEVRAMAPMPRVLLPSVSLPATRSIPEPASVDGASVRVATTPTHNTARRPFDDAVNSRIWPRTLHLVSSRE